MRCMQCDVDLPDSYHVCPLCGEAVSDTPNQLPIEEAPYPDVTQSVEADVPAAYPNKHVLRVIAVLCAVSLLIGQSTLWTLFTPILLGLCALFYFVCALFEKGKLLRSGVCLLSTVAVALVLQVFGLLLRLPMLGISLAAAGCIAVFVLLCLLFPARMRAQLQATFHA